MTTPDVSGPVVRDLKERLAKLSLLFLGQHLWSLAVALPTEPYCCLCRCCEEARKAYELATGAWPTTEQEHTAMKAWGLGQTDL